MDPPFAAEGSLATVTVSDWLADWPSESVTTRSKVEVPSEVGVPETSPVVVSRVRPAGRVPLATDQVSGPVPPEVVGTAS